MSNYQHDFKWLYQTYYYIYYVFFYVFLIYDDTLFLCNAEQRSSLNSKTTCYFHSSSNKVLNSTDRLPNLKLYNLCVGLLTVSRSTEIDVIWYITM